MSQYRKALPENTDILCHGDGDGIISAAVLRKNGALGNVTLTQPFLIHKLPVLKNSTVIVDIAVDNKNPQATIEWARANVAQILEWIDHHEGGELLKEVLGDKLIHDPTAPSCPDLIFKSGFEVPAEWVDAANACDRPTDYKPTALSTRLNSAFKVALVELQEGDKTIVDKVQKAQIEELATGKLQTLVDERVAQYTLLLKNTNMAVEGFKEVAPGIVATELGTAKVDLTALFNLGYKKAPVVVFQKLSPETGEPISIVATNRKDLNLVQTFGLKSGAPFRITLTSSPELKDHEAQLAQVIKALSA